MGNFEDAQKAQNAMENRIMTSQVALCDKETAQGKQHAMQKTSLSLLFFTLTTHSLDSEWSRKARGRSMPGCTSDFTCQALPLITTWFTLKNKNHGGEME